MIAAGQLPLFHVILAQLGKKTEKTPQRARPGLPF